MTTDPAIALNGALVEAARAWRDANMGDSALSAMARAFTQELNKHGWGIAPLETTEPAKETA